MIHYWQQAALHTTYEQLSKHRNDITGKRKFASKYESDTNDGTVNAKPAGGILLLYNVVGVRFKKAGKIYYFDPVDFIFRRRMICNS